RVIIILNDNGRSYAPTVSKLGESVSRLRLNPGYVHWRDRLEQILRDLPAVGELAYSSLQGMKAAIREVVEPTVFFEALGVRYTGPIDGHDIAGVEDALRNAAAFDGPIVVHVLTQKGRGYSPAETDDEKCLHDAPTFDPVTGPPKWAPTGYTEAFAEAMLDVGERHPQVHAITAAMPGPTGLIPFAERFPDRFHDVGIAEQHAATAAAGMAMGGLRPVVAVYSTFFTRAFDQAMYDVGLHGLPVVFALDRAGITGDDGPSHHGVLDLSLALNIPGMTVFAPSSAQDLAVMLRTALELEGPAVIRYPKGAARQVDPVSEVGSGLAARRVRTGASGVCLLAVGKMVGPALEAAAELDATVWDVRVVKPLDPAMLADAAAHELVVTVEDGVKVGGAGSFIAASLAGPPVLSLGVPDAFIAQAKPGSILARLGLDGPGIAASVRAALSSTAP
ncbi:MAG TPA: 1-deoxy-D-xylulose-5-phosphate synthase N-terminal domain-containing protein, partial [Acidimicrobiales bacterium]|nr:1-deoxy-D-xylulose-5-phosphate synthase N-terminal domain-containing protein [Acidimicrobiales bacterium]